MEWNQAVTKEKIIKAPLFLHGEIVQLGAVMLDESFAALDSFEVFIRPVHYVRMNSLVKRLTGLSNARLKEGLPFAEAMARFFDWCGGADYCFITWGRDDMPILRENLVLHGMDTAFLPPVYDLQRVFDAQIAQENRQWALATAMEKLALPFVGRAHDALSDAESTACICAALDMPRGLAEYQEPPKREPRKRQAKRARLANAETVRGFASRAQAFCDMAARQFYCPECGAELTCGKWLSFSGDRKMAMASCEEHGEYMVRIRVKKNAAEGYRICRALCPADDAARAAFAKARPGRHGRAKRPAAQAESAPAALQASL